MQLVSQPLAGWIFHPTLRPTCNSVHRVWVSRGKVTDSIAQCTSTAVTLLAATVVVVCVGARRRTGGRQGTRLCAPVRNWNTTGVRTSSTIAYGAESANAGVLTADAPLEEEVPPVERDHAGRIRLQYKPDGWSSWTWESTMLPNPFKCHYIAAGPVDGAAVVLVHGFGASSYHWRYQIPALAERGFRVYSLCLLGYGWSPRAVLRYTGEIWAAQIEDFLRHVVGRPAVLVGNSVGAFATLLTASLEPSLCRGLVMLNAAGRFEDRQPGVAPARQQVGDVVAAAAEQASPGPLQCFLNQVARAVAGWAFWTTKLRIQPILQWVYVNNDQVDDDLVMSIREPAEHPDALDTFGEVIQAGRRTGVTVFDALDKLPSKMPLLLLWGMKDPWMRPARAHAIQHECAQRGIECDFEEIDAGHCPHDDSPDAVNEALITWLKLRNWDETVQQPDS